MEPLTDAEQHAMNSYISSSSYVWNDKLRRGEKLTKQEETVHKGNGLRTSEDAEV